jgi:hypothetical protein
MGSSAGEAGRCSETKELRDDSVFEKWAGKMGDEWQKPGREDVGG